MNRKAQKRILIVDDDRTIRGFTRSILESSDYRVDTAETVARATKKIKDSSYDLLVFDVSMPGNNIVRLFQALKESKKYSGIPILFTLGPRAKETLDLDRQKALEAAEAYIQKPLRSKDFLAKINELLGNGHNGKKIAVPAGLNSSRWQFWTAWQRQPMVPKSPIDSEGGSQK